MSDKKIINLDELKNKNIEWQKITRIGISLVIFFVLIGFILSNVFVVKQGEYKVIRQFGEVVKIIKEPGLNFKIPFIQSVQTLPKYQKFYEVQQAEINTKDKKRMLVDNYAVWRIEDPKKMIANLRTVENAEAKMSEFIFSIVRTELGQLNYDEIIDEENSNRGSFNETVTNTVNQLLQQDNYGIIVTDIRMKRIDLPAENEESVYKRMISERETKAQEYLSMGDAEKNRIIANTDREVKELLAKAQADAEKIRAEGEQTAAQTYNQSFSQDPSFYNLYRTLESYKRTIDGETVIMLPANSPYAKLLMGYTQ
ncbi:MAG TPA: protease modulator HflC [Bacillus bacterium]|nr:protease modulator HflC [Bacillus sp. (in: firmicutes)]